MFFIGSVVGSLVFGILADKIGRLHILVISNVIAMIGNVLTMFATDVILFSMCRLVAGLATDSNFVMMYILGKELVFINSENNQIKSYNNSSYGVHSSLDANLWTQSMHWTVLLSWIDDHSMDRGCIRTLENVPSGHIFAYITGAFLLSICARECSLAYF